MAIDSTTLKGDDALSYRLTFPQGYCGQWEDECFYKGWLSGVIVELATGSTFRLTFVDMNRLGQMMEDQIASGKNFCGEPGLIVVRQVTRADIEAAVNGLIEENFFDDLARSFRTTAQEASPPHDA